MRRATSGQATVELAIGSLVFVTVLLFGIHFAEISMVTLKVKEANAFATLEATAHRAHWFHNNEINSGTTFKSFDPTQWGKTSKARYQDFEGLSDSAGTTAMTLALTRAEGLSLRCDPDGAIRFSVRPAPKPANLASSSAAYQWLTARYRDNGGLMCTAQARVSAIRVPGQFAERSSGFFGAEHLDDSLINLPVCGTGEPINGKCKGKLVVMMGDWGLDGDVPDLVNDDVRSVQWGLQENTPYENMVERLFVLNGGKYANAKSTPGQRLLRIGAGMKPGKDPEWFNETVFNMSFKGETPAPGIPTIRPNDMRAPDTDGPSALEYQTSGAHLKSSYVGWNDDHQLTGVTRCFLGLRGCATDP
jgi:hypothetical protein